MAEFSEYFQKQHKRALFRVAEYFSARGDFEFLSEESENQETLPKGCNIWKSSIYASGDDWLTYFIFTEKFPIEPPIVISPKAAKLYLENPHVLEKGRLCILPDSSSFDSTDIERILRYFIDATRKILSGTSEDDFREEFSVYWDRKVEDFEKECLIVSAPNFFDNTFYVCWSKGLIIISHDELYLNQWCNNLLENEMTFDISKDGICIDIDSPLSPLEYPDNCYDVLELARNRDKIAYAILSDRLAKTVQPILVLLRQSTGNGFSLGCIKLQSLGLNRLVKIQKGFRLGHTPSDILIKKSKNILKSENVNRFRGVRADYDWIHSRGGDGHLYAEKSIIVIGCGSVGGYIAHTLAKSGVGKLLLIDKETLEWANIGRHILGASYVGNSKSKALKKYILKEMPHLDVEAIYGDWLQLYQDNTSLFNGYDSIIVSIADWKNEKPLNYFSLNNIIPSVFFTWLEPFAVAGHCFVSSHCGCLNCYMNNFGQFKYSVTDFQSKILLREPGGCTFYQPYGPTALLNTVTLTCKTLFQHFKKPIDSVLFSWISDKEHFDDCGASITDLWVDKLESEGYSKVYETNLPPINCELCNP